jgi:hypothetical protein
LINPKNSFECGLVQGRNEKTIESTISVVCNVLTSRNCPSTTIFPFNSNKLQYFLSVLHNNISMLISFPSDKNDNEDQKQLEITVECEQQ